MKDNIHFEGFGYYPLDKEILYPQAELQEDVISTIKGKVYGKKGEIVKVYADKENVLIVENSRGNRYPVSITKVKHIDNGMATDK